MDQEEIRLSLRNIRDLPTLPGVANRILEVTSDSESGARELADIVIHDQSLSAKVIHLANSAFFGFSRPITTIPQAVVVLGFDEVKSLALGASVFETLSQPSGKIGYDRRAFWMHSIGCATASRLIARALGVRVVQEDSNGAERPVYRQKRPKKRKSPLQIPFPEGGTTLCLTVS